MTANWNHRTPLPEHAIAELDTPEGRKFWERWAEVGDAKLAEAEASQHVVDIENDWHACCITHRVNLPNCGCGQHPGLYLRAKSARDNVRAEVAAAVERFKAE